MVTVRYQYSSMTLIFAAIILVVHQFFQCQAWTAATNINIFLRSNTISSASKRRHYSKLKGSLLEEPDNQFGRLSYWDDEYRQSLNDDEEESNNNDATAETFSWYCGWDGELEPFFAELVPLQSNPTVLVPGIGNDACIRDMFDSGYHRLTAFDYAPEGVECAKRMFGPERLQLMDDLRVADARSLPYDDASFDAVLEKGTLDSIYLSGGMDKELARKHLGMAVSELARVVKVGGIVFSVTAACVDAVQRSFDECTEVKGCWKQVRDGSVHMTDDGYTSNNVDATMLAWERIE